MFSLNYSNLFYRYVNNSEKQDIVDNRKIQSRNPIGTYFTSNRFEVSSETQRFLSLRTTPEYRVGPIAVCVMPVFDIVSLRITPPAYGQPGGGTEACTSHPVYIFGVFNFNHNIYEM